MILIFFMQIFKVLSEKYFVNDSIAKVNLLFPIAKSNFFFQYLTENSQQNWVKALKLK